MRTVFSGLMVMLFLVVASAQTDSVVYTQGFNFRPGIYLSYAQFKSNSPIPKSALISNEDTSRLDFIRLVISKESVQWRDSSGNIQSENVSSLWGYSENKSVYIRYHYYFNRLMVIGTLCHFTAYETNYMYTGPGTYPNQQYGSPVESMQQFVLDTQTGNVYPFDVKNMEPLLSRDAELYAEFVKLKKKQKKDQLFLYLRRYNEKHPLYLRQ